MVYDIFQTDKIIVLTEKREISFGEIILEMHKRMLDLLRKGNIAGNDIIERKRLHMQSKREIQILAERQPLHSIRDCTAAQVCISTLDDIEDRRPCHNDPEIWKIIIHHLHLPRPVRILMDFVYIKHLAPTLHKSRSRVKKSIGRKICVVSRDIQ